MCIVYIIVKYTLFTHHHNLNVIHASKTQITNLGVGWGGGGVHSGNESEWVPSAKSVSGVEVVNTNI